MFPIRFRQLSGDAQFNRWQWVEYRYGRPRDDPRKESRRIYSDTIKPGSIMPMRDRAAFLAPLILQGLHQAADRGDSLALVRPLSSSFYWRSRSAAEMDDARAAYRLAARQENFLDPELAAFEPPPFDFRLKWSDADGEHNHRCGDWETTAAFFNLCGKLGVDGVLGHLRDTYQKRSLNRGLVLAMGNMKKRPKQWQLLSLLTLPEAAQMGLSL